MSRAFTSGLSLRSGQFGFAGDLDSAAHPSGIVSAQTSRGADAPTAAIVVQRAPQWQRCSSPCIVILNFSASSAC
jgi:hypothetical protein